VKHHSSDFDIIVVGGGHAGVEACLATARLGLNTLLVTHSETAIARMSCNPAIGGLAKGHLVSEIDALGGEMAKVIDQTGLQFKILNRSKGRAVWSPRAQADKITYPQTMQKLIRAEKTLTVLEGNVSGIRVKKQRVLAVYTDRLGEIACHALILTCGTFLNGLMHIGLEHFSGGRLGEPAATGLTAALTNIGFQSGRLKTGTPPRISARTIDVSKTTPQYGDPDPTPFSFQTEAFNPENIPCYITHTNLKTHEILVSGLDRSPLFQGIIKGVGPRYCPSIEDKIFRFRDKDRHQLFLEPEWKDSDEIYVNGFSTSLPIDIQLAALHSIPGLENCEIIRPGYAIEYDYFPARQLYRTLESKLISGLFLAGQVNGTSGYEEAAALGLMAGINAALKIHQEAPLVLSRSESYIGVLIDDLITKSPDEPYRMFTSSAEYRLLLRFDNADQRLAAKGAAIGLLPQKWADRAQQKRVVTAEFITYAKSKYLTSREYQSLFPDFPDQGYKSGFSLHQMLCRQDIHFSQIQELVPSEILQIITKWRGLSEQIETDIKYTGYIQRHLDQIDAMRKYEDFPLPENLDYQNLKALTIEAREKLLKFKPETLGQASRIAGISPADITALLIILKK
jgi:tRNA uridine 5-carboxymethylaminomethyl modification enzyme